MRLIGIAGKAGTGKDSMAKMLYADHGFQRIAFADPLRSALYELFCLPVGSFDAERKEQAIEWLGHSPRQLMQWLGTEFGRNLLGADVWIKLAQRRIDLHRSARGGNTLDIAFTDVRFDNEAEWIRAQGGRIVHLTRAGAAPVHAHASEAGVAYVDGDARYANDGPPEAMRAWVYQFVGEWRSHD